MQQPQKLENSLWAGTAAMHRWGKFVRVTASPAELSTCCIEHECNLICCKPFSQCCHKYLHAQCRHKSLCLLLFCILAAAICMQHSGTTKPTENASASFLHVSLELEISFAYFHTYTTIHEFLVRYGDEDPAVVVDRAHLIFPEVHKYASVLPDKTSKQVHEVVVRQTSKHLLLFCLSSCYWPKLFTLHSAVLHVWVALLRLECIKRKTEVANLAICA